jgi:Zn-dependent peptidase ImmA (M78 family)
LTEITSEQARKVLEDEQRKRLEEFQQKLEALCKEYNVSIQVQQNIVVVPNAA